MEFKKGSEYTRDQIHNLYFQKPLPKKGTGNWKTGYVRIKEELIVFMNIDVPGRTGHDFDNRYNPSEKTIVWYGKPDSHSQQPMIQKLINGKIKPHFFARWDNRDPKFVYLGIGKIITFEDDHPTKRSDGTSTTCFQMTLSCEDADKILPTATDSNVQKSNFAMEKHLEEFIIENWDSTDIGKDYDRHEDEIDGKRKKFKTDTGEIDIFAISKDKTEYLVIELKKGRATYSVVGQIQSYMGYVKDEIANKNQKVKGLIIALEDDLSLKRALSINPEINFRRYQIGFDLMKSEL